MKTIAFEVDGVIYTQVFTDENHTVEFDHIVLKNPPNEPQESWYIEGGEIKIDQQKLIEFNRQNMPQLTPIEFDIKLVDAGLYDQVQILMQSDVKLRIAYTRATFFSRLDPFIIQTSEALGLTGEQVDAIWVS